MCANRVKPVTRLGISPRNEKERTFEEAEMRTTRMQRMLHLTAGSVLAACTIFGTAGLAAAGDDGPGGGKDPAPNPPPGGPTIPKDPGEGLPVPLPGGGG
jgi:hypothetical protein